MEYEVPDAAGDSVTVFHPARAVVVQVISLEMPEEAIARLSKMQEIVGPLFSDITLHHTRK